MEKYEWLDVLKGAYRVAKEVVPITRTGHMDFDNEFAYLVHEIETFASGGKHELSFMFSRFTSDEYAMAALWKLEAEYGLNVKIYKDYATVSGWAV